jgi:hypothetical protein
VGCGEPIAFDLASTVHDPALAQVTDLLRAVGAPCRKRALSAAAAFLTRPAPPPIR